MRDINDFDADGRTVLHAAVLAGDRLLVRRLLMSGADPNIRDATESGYTPAILSVLLGSRPVIAEFSRDWRTDWDKNDGAGLTAKHYAAAGNIGLCT